MVLVSRHSRQRFVCLMLVLASCAGISAQITWRRTYGGFGSDNAYSVRQTSDGGYIIAGSTGSFGSGSGDIYVVRVNEYGDPLWSRAYGGIGVEKGIACRELSDGFIIAGSTSLGENGGYDMLLIRTDLSGTPLWERNYGTTEWDLCNAFDVMSNGFLLGGISYGSGSLVGAAYVIKTDLNGDTLWTKWWGDALTKECNGLSATQDQGFVMAGHTATSAGYDDGFVRKYDEDGSEQWTTFAGGDSADYLSSVLETPTGEFVAIGGTRSFSSYQRIYLLGLDPVGVFAWDHLFGILSDAGGSDVRNGHDGGYVFTGYNTLNLGARDMILTATDSDGWVLHGFNYGDGLPADGHSTDPTDDGGYVVAGWCEGYGPGARAMYVVKTDSIVLTSSLSVSTYLDPLGVSEVFQSSRILMSPNPVANVSALKVELMGLGVAALHLLDPTSRLCLSAALHQGQNTIALSGISPGIYCAQVIQDGRVIHSGKLVVE